MKRLWGIEWTSDASAEDIQEYDWIDRADMITVTDCSRLVTQLKEEKHTLIEDVHELLQTDLSVLYGTFTDYGFTSEAGRNYFLSEMILSFRLTSRDPLQERMCRLQTEEHLIAENGSVLFTDADNLELMKKMADSYGVCIEFGPRQTE
ncbi:hypothetical protein ACTSEZ_18760 [Metabacillus sp. JX24]|uniref:hypothetical protein n=1 Tax=Metabacillus sp. JX24 TaxID=3240759 RepID=UPI0035108E45